VLPLRGAACKGDATEGAATILFLGFDVFLADLRATRLFRPRIPNAIVKSVLVHRHAKIHLAFPAQPDENRPDIKGVEFLPASGLADAYLF
jgi:hypothetical protein